MEAGVNPTGWVIHSGYDSQESQVTTPLIFPTNHWFFVHIILLRRRHFPTKVREKVVGCRGSERRKGGRKHESRPGSCAIENRRTEGTGEDSESLPRSLIHYHLSIIHHSPRRPAWRSPTDTRRGPGQSHRRPPARRPGSCRTR